MHGCAAATIKVYNTPLFGILSIDTAIIEVFVCIIPFNKLQCTLLGGAECFISVIMSLYL
ncbi:hypothetical protein GAMM_40001 [Gammaproteobacteria bacterium]